MGHGTIVTESISKSLSFSILYHLSFYWCTITYQYRVIPSYLDQNSILQTKQCRWTRSYTSRPIRCSKHSRSDWSLRSSQCTLSCVSWGCNTSTINQLRDAVISNSNSILELRNTAPALDGTITSKHMKWPFSILINALYSWPLRIDLFGIDFYADSRLLPWLSG